MATKKKSAANAAPKKKVAAAKPKKSAPKKKVAAAKPKKAAPKKKLAAKPKKAAPKKKLAAAKPKKAAPKKKVAAKPKKAAPKKKLAAKPTKAPKAAPKKAVAKPTSSGQTKSRSPKKAEKPSAEAPEQTSSRRAPAAEKKLDALRLTALFSVSPERIYDAWLDAVEHGLLTGGAATGSPEVGGRHTAWDGYIEGTNVELERPSKIVQTWRTTEFPEDAEDSRLEITLVPEGDGTLLVLHHTSIPEGQGARYESGWETHYFEPMRKYFD
jgi:uncharacterized protein YndB with AHSA1/START domain